MKKQPTTPLEDWITTAEAARIMGVTQRHVIHLVSREQIEGKKITDRLILVNLRSVEAWTPKRRKRKEKSID